MNVYYIEGRYPEQRCIINRVSKFTYVPIMDLGKERPLKGLLEKLQHIVGHRYSEYLGEKTLSCYWLIKRSGIIHTFNSCISGRNNWCATFETIIPRTNFTRNIMSSNRKIDKRTIKFFRLLARKNCFGCMALSQAAYDLQMYALRELKEYLTEKELLSIERKTLVIPPPQELLISKEEIKQKFNCHDTLELIFVGNDFFRKGGKELIDCLLQFKNQYSFHLTVVSAMNYEDYASRATYEEAKRYREILIKEEWVTFFENLPNEKVLSLCKKAHVGFLPTFADTYGYSVLEMQACGCAVLTTDIRALTEINSETCGWICHLPQNSMKEALYNTEEERIILKQILYQQLSVRIYEILEASSNDLMDKAIESLERVKEYHNPEKYEKKIEQIMQGQYVL